MTEFYKHEVREWVSEKVLRNSFPNYEGNLDELAEKLVAEKPLTPSESIMAIQTGIVLRGYQEGLNELDLYFMSDDECSDEIIHIVGWYPGSDKSLEILYGCVLHLNEEEGLFSVPTYIMKAYECPTGDMRIKGFERALVKLFIDHLKPESRDFQSLDERGLNENAPDTAQKAYEEYCRQINGWDEQEAAEEVAFTVQKILAYGRG